MKKLTPAEWIAILLLAGYILLIFYHFFTEGKITIFRRFGAIIFILIFFILILIRLTVDYNISKIRRDKKQNKK